MKALKTALLGAILIMCISSCGNSEPVAVETTVATTTTISYGKDCNKVVADKLSLLNNDVEVAWENATDNGGTPSRSEYVAKVSALRDLRSYVRKLDIPTVSIEQSVFVNVIDEYLDAYNAYWESGKRDLSVNNYITDMNDASSDFYRAFWEVCPMRSA